MTVTRRKGEAETRNAAVLIRPALLEDLTAIQRIARAAYALYVPRIGREPAPMVADFAAAIGARHVWVADDPVTAFVVAYPRGDHWHLENVAVDPSGQGQGLGRALIAHVETMARTDGARAVELYTNALMIENQRLYPRLGYAITKRAVEEGFARVFYRKELAADGPIEC